MVLPCAKHAFERDRFLAAFKRWLIKSGFTLAETKESAEGIVQGTLSIYESAHPLVEFRREKENRIGKKDDDCEVEEAGGPQWNVDAWLVNQNGRRLWKLGFDYPSISYAGGPAKIEGKKLAKALEYDFKHDR
jgi:hypothetical protein